MRTIQAAALLGVFVTASQAAQAQTVIINRPSNSPGGVEKAQRVSVNVQLSMPAPTLTSVADWTKAIETANQSLYEIINHECDVLGAALKGGCRLVQINTGGNAGNRVNTSAGTDALINVNANATFEIDPKIAPPATPSQQ